ncbi:MAG: HEAT repeat domain-containing protein, partial [Pseudomonadota bacterium]
MDHGTSETLSRDLLAALELKNVAITAALGPDGKLSPIGGLWEKLGQQAAIELARRGLLRIVVVAEGQKGVPEEYLREDAEPLRVIRAESVADAIGQLHVQAAPYQSVRQSERKSCATMDLLGRTPVPLEQHYQVLPLLQEIKEEQLPRSADSGDHSEEGALRQVDILRWEEQVREEHKQYERVALTEAFEDYSKVVKDAKTTIPRLVILGPPGSGKTTVMQYLAWLAVNQQLKWNDRPLLPTRVRLHDWEAWLRKHSKTGLADYLSQHYRDQKHSPTAEQWRHWLHRGDVLVLLDGLDELDDDPAFTATLTTTLSTFTACPTVLSCRTVSYQRYQSLGPDFAVFTLAGLDEVQRDAYIRAFPAEQPVYFSPEALIDQLSQMPQLHPLVANPLLLSIICFVVDDPQGVKLPATHSALYERAVNKLLDRYPNRVEVPYPGVKPDFYRKRVIVEQIALSLFAKGKNTLTFTSGELAEALERSIEVKYPASLADPIREDLIQNSGLLRGTPEHGFFFLYLTLQEFLAAGALARLVNERGMQEELTVAGITRTIYEWVDRKAWDPRWQEVIVLLTGQLKDPAPLLELLADEKKDDYFRHRLALAALCLPELSEGYRQTHAEIIDHITDVAFFCWWEHEMNDTEAAVPHLARACPALAQVNGRIEDKPLQNWLVQRLGTPDKEGETAIKAIGHLVRSAATKEFVTALAECLCDGEASVRRAAARVVGEIGSKAVNKEFLGALAKYLGDGEAAVRWAAIRAVGEIGSAAATDGILAALAERLGDEKASVQKAAVWAVGEIGSAAAKD